ncbi:hypothetical protein Misp01_52390 [Microtetraspora sp. NBRC 13810]|uniref:ATP-binding protein n=1 Tax=Microtetraspora sp. NBRC 13810 TaxID=3030990 RepID=UPI0025541458|nr:ATP-binding protein [Microtetraspora sp. NBRC 13810]GLW10110.1 hypothetical protein Misp01_52390 [Microtetraspora sp. NBRC 13810]
MTAPVARIATRELRWALRAEPQAAGEARRLARNTLGLWGLEHLDDVELVVGELVANAIVHGRGPVSLALLHGRDSLRVEVADQRPDWEPMDSDAWPSLDDEHGRGLPIVSACTDLWGVEYAPRPEDGKVVWCSWVIPRPRAAE